MISAPLPSALPDETCDDLILGGMKLFQKRDGYRFSLDAVILAHWAKARKNGKTADFGTASGVIPLLMSHLNPTASFIGVELQPQLAEMAGRSVSLNGLTDRIRILKADIKNLSEDLPRESLDGIVCNPPFFKVGEGKVSPQPEKAIARHELEVTLKDIIHTASLLLKPGRSLSMIINAARTAEAMDLCSAHRLTPIRLRPVYSRTGENAVLTLLEAEKLSRKGLTLEAPLIIYNENGYSREIASWYTPTERN